MNEWTGDPDTRHLSYKLFRKFHKEGWMMILENGKEFMLSRERRKDPQNVTDSQPITLVYGFIKLSRICAACLLWIPSFILDIRLGLYPSKSFIFSSYSVAVTASIIGCALANTLFASTFRLMLPGILKQVSNFLTTVAQITMYFNIVYSCMILAHITYHRKYLNDFILFKCSNISLPGEHQTRTLAFIFFSTWICCSLSEPLFVVLTMHDEFVQPYFLPNIPQNVFWIIKWTFMISIGIATTVMNIIQHIIPMMTSFLICMVEKYIDTLVTKLTKRLYEFEAKKRTDIENVGLTALMDDCSYGMIADHSVETLCCDWPDFDESKFNEEKNYDIPRQDDKMFNSLATGSRIFLFRNLIKSLSELKDVAIEYSHVFGIVHFITVCFSGLLVTQWIVIVIVKTMKNVDPNAKIDYKGTIYVRTVCYTIVFLTANTITFTRCDRLRSRLQKLRSQMFKVNLDLVDLFGGDQVFNNSAWQETQMAWTLYDQFCVTSRGVEFKLVGTTRYSKHCLMLIFGRLLSIVLFYLQIVDIYSTDSGH